MHLKCYRFGSEQREKGRNTKEKKQHIATASKPLRIQLIAVSVDIGN